MGPSIGLLAVGSWLALASPWGSEASQKLAKRAYAAQQERDYATSLRIYRNGYDLNVGRDQLAACKFMQGVGGSQLGLYKFRDALASFLEARRLAFELNDDEDLGSTAGNLASLYLQINDIASARETAQQALDYLKRAPQAPYRIQLFYIRAAVAMRQNYLDEALAFYRQGIEAADRAKDDQQLMVGLNRLAYALMKAGRLDEAENAVLEVFRYRFLHHDRDIVYCYPILAEIEMRRGHLDQAKILSKRGVELARSDPRGLPFAESERVFAKILERRGEYREAHLTFMAAISTARRWRLELLPADNARIAGESSLSGLYDEALENAAHLYFDTPGHPQDVAADAFLQAEDWRTTSLRRFLAERDEWLADVGPDYWELLERFRKLDAASVHSPTNEGAAELQRLQVRLAELESFAGVHHLIRPSSENFPSLKTLTPYRRSLRGSQTLISFQLGETMSHRWILDSSGLSWSRLPSRNTIAHLSDEFRQAVESGSSSAGVLGIRLGNMLFGNMSGDAGQAKSWVLVLDDALFQIPFPALRLTGRDGVDRYLIERRSLTALPGAWSLLAKPVASWKGDFVGVADAVYNSADPRWTHKASYGSTRPASAAWLRLAGETATEPPSSQLPRIAASQQEVEAAAQAWSPDDHNILLIGLDANLRGLKAALSVHPSVLHFAVHVIPNPKALDRAYIALSLADNGSPELLSTSDVAHLKLSDSLVVLSGCHSARGSALPGSGLIGLVRAWLMSGAAAVIASLWLTPDDRGVIFESFYKELRTETNLPGQSPVRSAAEALRRAQLEMLRTKSWRAHPKYWATYLITGRTS